MPRVLITDHEFADRLIGERRAAGLNTYDEMWDGVYRVVPAGNGAHGYVQMQIGALLTAQVRRLGFACTGPINIGDEHSYRVPDVAVIASAPVGSDVEVFHETALLIVEVRSKDDSTYQKFSFYDDHEVAEIVVALPDECRIEVWVRDSRPGHTYVRREDSAVLQRTGCVVWLENELGWGITCSL